MTATTTVFPGSSPMDALERDRWGRPLILKPGQTKPVPYTRVSTLAKALDDTTALTAWKQRMTAVGLAKRQDLIDLVRATDPNGPEARRALNDAVESAMAAAESDRKANLGTAIHAFAEAVDKGATMDSIPGEHRGRVQAYRDAIAAAGLTVIACERFIVNDDLEAAGTFDRLYLRNPEGKLRIGDLKTGGDPKWYALATAMQVAVYARGSLYDPTTGERRALPADRSIGYLVHVPQDRTEATVYELDLDEGWRLACLAFDVRQAKKAKVLGPVA